MVAATFNLTGNYVVEQGATWSVVITAVDGNGSPINLSDGNWAARSDFKASYTGALVIKPTCNITDGANGEITMSLTAVQTAGIGTPGQATSGVYDLEVYHTDGTVIRVAKGVWSVDPEVTTSAT